MPWIARMRWPLNVTATIILLGFGNAHASLVRNAAGAKNMGMPGRFTADTAGQFEREADGWLWKVESGLQCQISNRLQFLVEMSLYEAQRPRTGPHASGSGDAEITASWLLSAAQPQRPSVVLAASVKLPTAARAEIGTNRADYSALVILQKEAGEFELALEGQFTAFGQPEGEELRDQFLYTFTIEYGVNDFAAVYGEVSGNSAPTASEPHSDTAKIGVELDIPVAEWAAPYFDLEYDTAGVGSVRAGVEWTW